LDHLPCGYCWTTTPCALALPGGGTSGNDGWAELTYGELLRLAEESGFDAMITTDKGIRYQQNLSGRLLALLVISTNDWTRIRKSTAMVVEAIAKVSPGSFLEVEIPFVR
jgi:hypothetical protein